MDITKRVKNAVQALTNKTDNSLGVSEANRFLRYGSGQKPLVQNWSEVRMSDEDMYTGYSYAAIVKRANRTSVLGRRFIMTEASVKTTDEYRSREEELVHPYLKVINRSKDFTKKMFWYEISTYLDLEGVYYLGAVRNSRVDRSGNTIVGAVQKFVLINPYEIRKVIKESNGEVGGYVESHNGFYREWAPEQIIEIRMLNPFDKDKAYAMTDAAKDSQFTLKQAGDYTRQTINGNISAPGIVSTDVLLDDQKFENFKARVTGRQKGEPIFGNGSGAIRWQDMQVDLDKAALDKINEIQSKILFAVSGTGKTVLGIEESGTTRDTSKTQDENFTVDAIVPRAEDICDALNLDYRKWYSEWEENEFEIVVNSPVEKDRDAEVKDIQIRSDVYDLAEKLIKAGYERTAAFKYAKGEIEWDELGEPKTAQTDDDDDSDDTPNDGEEETGITEVDTDTDEPEMDANPKDMAENTVYSKVNNQVSARDFPDLYEGIDINTDDLGCIMLDTEKLDIAKYVDTAEADLVEATSRHDHAMGAVAEKKPHVTLLYGLLENGNKWKDKVDLLLKDWKLDSVTIEEVGYFEQPEGYVVIAHIEKTDELIDGHERLTLLPHINTFSEYKPHMSLAYINADADVDKWVELLGKQYNGKTLKVIGINYGSPEDTDDKSDNHIDDEHAKPKPKYLNKDAEDAVKLLNASEMPKDGPHGNSGNVLAAVGQDHHAVSPTGLILAQNALDSDTRDIIKAQENALRDGFARIEREMLAAVDANEDITDGTPLTEAQINQFEQDAELLLTTFYINLYPIFGRQLLAQRALEYGQMGTYEMTQDAQAYISEMAAKAAESHVATVIKDIAQAIAISYAVITAIHLLTLIKAALAIGDAFTVKQFDGTPNPTDDEIKQAIADGKFDNTDMYKEAQRLAREGASRDEIVRAVQDKYPEISKNRATTIARTEAARVFNQSQFEADRQFLNSSGLMSKAYKKLRSRTGEPCVHCKLLIDKPPIPFMQNFADLGTVLSATETKEDGSVKVKALPVNWESIKAGNVHPNCNCEYVLIINN